MKRAHLIVLSTLLAVAVIALAAYYRYTHPPVAATLPTTTPATQAATQSTSPRIARREKGPTTQLLDILRADNPRYPTTQPLDTPLDLKFAAHALLTDAVYLDLQGHLWITRPDAPETFDFAKAGQSRTRTHVVRDVVRFVLWAPAAGAEPGAPWVPHLVVDAPASGGFELVTADARRPLADPHGFRWDLAQVLYGPPGVPPRIIAPTSTGLCAFAFDEDPAAILKSHHALLDPAKHKPADCVIRTAMDLRGVLAWVTTADGAKGVTGAGIARFAPVAPPAAQEPPPPPPAYAWTSLTGKPGWPDRIVHLVPLLDGSVLQISTPETTDPAERDKVAFSMNSLDSATTKVDTGKVIRHVLDLSSTELEKRDAAFKALTQYGPGIAPLIEKLKDDQPPEAQIRIEQLLKAKIEPGLGGMTLVDGRMRLVSRFADGGALFHAEAGVSIPQAGEDQPKYITPAWLSIRPGHAVELLPPGLSADLNLDKQSVLAWQGEWVVQDPLTGPHWYLGNRLEPLLRKTERQFTRFVGIDGAGRWIFKSAQPDAGRVPVASPAPATLPTTSTSPLITTASPARTQSVALAAPRQFAQTLILDPRLPDATPRLPAWALPASAGGVGWDKNHWPVIFIDSKPASAWALQENDWRVIDPAKEKVFTTAADVPAIVAPPLPPRRPATAPAASQPSTATRPATTSATSAPASDTDELSDQAIAAWGNPILVTPDGRRFYDGLQSLKILHPDRSRTTISLPDSAVGSSPNPVLLRTREGLLFLFNQPGRIVRLRENAPLNAEDPPTTPAPAEIEFEAVFTRKVTADASPLRIWLDPADRICIAHDSNQVTVFFTTGRIPRSIVEKMPVEELPSEE